MLNWRDFRKELPNHGQIVWGLLRGREENVGGCHPDLTHTLSGYKHDHEIKMLIFDVNFDPQWDKYRECKKGSFVELDGDSGYEFSWNGSNWDKVNFWLPFDEMPLPEFPECKGQCK